MDYLDEYDDARPRVLFKGGRVSSPPTPAIAAVSKPHLAICLSAALLLFLAAYYSLDSSILFSFLIWFGFSLLLAPFAPVSATGGEFSVGRGPVLPEVEEEVVAIENADAYSNRRGRSRKQVERLPEQNQVVFARSDQNSRSEQKSIVKEKKSEEQEQESEWTETDLDLLKKQMAKFNVAGDPNRWEKISIPFKGKHGLESVIRKVKSIQERKAVQDDPFEQFLKKRKPVDPQSGEGNNSEVHRKEESWSSSDDLALLNALKAFPKDVENRWDKIAEALPGKSKGGCVKRVGELKKGFRDKKASQ
ncbi:hypothetical protein LUZ60_011673 [Juncus effusus]|nr:hypothetical protein LUZ60_011673 [Juncus effusus]